MCAASHAQAFSQHGGSSIPRPPPDSPPHQLGRIVARTRHHECAVNVHACAVICFDIKNPGACSGHVHVAAELNGKLWCAGERSREGGRAWTCDPLPPDRPTAGCARPAHSLQSSSWRPQPATPSRCQSPVRAGLQGKRGDGSIERRAHCQASVLGARTSSALRSAERCVVGKIGGGAGKWPPGGGRGSVRQQMGGRAARRRM